MFGERGAYLSCFFTRKGPFHEKITTTHLRHGRAAHHQKKRERKGRGNFAFESGVISGLLEKKSMLMMVMRKEVVG